MRKCTVNKNLDASWYIRYDNKMYEGDRYEINGN